MTNKNQKQAQKSSIGNEGGVLQFTVQPHGVDWLIFHSFEYDYEQEIESQSVCWKNNKREMCAELQRALFDFCKVQLDELFSLFADGCISDDVLFMCIESTLNNEGFYTYLSKSEFIVFSPHEVDLEDEAIRNCLSKSEKKQSIIFCLSNVPASKVALIKANITEHINEEMRCEVFPPEIKTTLF